jgi:hypothetical protein
MHFLSPFCIHSISILCSVSVLFYLVSLPGPFCFSFVSFLCPFCVCSVSILCLFCVHSASDMCSVLCSMSVLCRSCVLSMLVLRPLNVLSLTVSAQIEGQDETKFKSSIILFSDISCIYWKDKIKLNTTETKQNDINILTRKKESMIASQDRREAKVLLMLSLLYWNMRMQMMFPMNPSTDTTVNITPKTEHLSSSHFLEVISALEDSLEDYSI